MLVRLSASFRQSRVKAERPGSARDEEGKEDEVITQPASWALSAGTVRYLEESDSGHGYKCNGVSVLLSASSTHQHQSKRIQSLPLHRAISTYNPFLKLHTIKTLHHVRLIRPEASLCQPPQNTYTMPAAPKSFLPAFTGFIGTCERSDPPPPVSLTSNHC